MNHAQEYTAEVYEFNLGPMTNANRVYSATNYKPASTDDSWLQHLADCHADYAFFARNVVGYKSPLEYSAHETVAVLWLDYAGQLCDLRALEPGRPCYCVVYNNRAHNGLREFNRTRKTRKTRSDKGSHRH